MRGLIFLRKEKIMNNQNGRSMIEMLGVLAIIGVLSVGGIAGYSKAMMKFKINKTIEQITHISQNIRTLYTNQKCYDFNSVTKFDMMKNTGLIPDNMIDEENGIENDEFGWEHYIYNPFGGGVFITGDDWECAFGDDDCEYKAFTITYFNLPKEACVQLAMMDWNNLEGIASFNVMNDTYLDNSGEVWRYYFGTGFNGCEEDEDSANCYSFLGSKVHQISLPLAGIPQACDCPNNTCEIIWGFK